MAVFVVRSVLGGDNFIYTQTPYFTDVPATHPYFPWIQKEQDLGIALTCGPNMFCPDNPVTRSQMAVLIIRARYGLVVPPNVPPTAAFNDIPSNGTSFPYVQKMAQVGITVGCAPSLYCGDTPVTRGQMAVFIMRGMFNLVPSGSTVFPLLNVAPASAVVGQTVTVTIQSQNTAFLPDSTQVSAGPGITVSNVVGTSPTTLTATLKIDPAATPGPRSIVVTANGIEATLPNVFQVTSH
jgi:hypothetical protein